MVSCAGENTMKAEMKSSVLGFAVVVMFMLFSMGPGTAQNMSETEIEITSVTGGLGGVTMEIKNAGEVTAEDVVVTISVEGGIGGNIDVQKICSGCSACGTELEPGATKTESTLEEQLILGLGGVAISVSASASNAAETSQSLQGWVIGPLVIIF